MALKKLIVLYSFFVCSNVLISKMIVLLRRTDRVLLGSVHEIKKDYFMILSGVLNKEKALQRLRI
jgi:hypothetical protein